MPEESLDDSLDPPLSGRTAVLREQAEPATCPWLEKLLGAGSRKGSLLLVDDDVNIRELLQSLLESKGYGVRTAGDGVECLRLAKVTRPDLILLNYLMPRMDGLCALRALKRDPIISYLKVVMYSAISDFERFSAECSAAGAVDCLHTPFEVKTFLAAVDRALRSR